MEVRDGLHRVAFGLFGTLLIYANAADIMPNAHEAAFLTSIMPYADQFDPMLVRLAFAFIVIGFGTKAGLFPMHTWLPDAHSQAPSPVSALLSGVLLKCAMLVIIRFYSLSIITVGDTYPRTLLLILGTLSILVAALCIFKQDDIKRRFRRQRRRGRAVPGYRWSARYRRLPAALHLPRFHEGARLLHGR